MSSLSSKKRVSWSVEEKRALGIRMREVLAEQPKLTPLEALTQAQLHVLPEERRRNVTAWTSVRDTIAPYLDVTQHAEMSIPLHMPASRSAAGQTNADVAVEPALVADPEAAPTVVSAPPLVSAAPPPDSVGAQETGSERFVQPELPGIPQAAGGRSAPGRRTQSNAVSPAALEAALLAALDSPLVAARLNALAEQALTDALTAALAKVNAVGPLAGSNVAGATAALTAPPDSRVLVVGLTAEQAQALAAQTRRAVELRFWRPGETREQLQSVARSCQLIILMSEAVDSDVDAFLESLPVRLLRHSGSVARLRERLVEIGERGLD